MILSGGDCATDNHRSYIISRCSEYNLIVYLFIFFESEKIEEKSIDLKAHNHLLAKF